MLQETEQTSRKYRIATFNARLDRNQICPANHNVGYYNGWYYFDEKANQYPELTRKAREFEENPNVQVFYNSGWNTYVLSYVSYSDGNMYPERQSPRV